MKREIFPFEGEEKVNKRALRDEEGGTEDKRMIRQVLKRGDVSVPEEEIKESKIDKENVQPETEVLAEALKSKETRPEGEFFGGAARIKEGKKPIKKEARPLQGKKEVIEGGKGEKTQESVEEIKRALIFAIENGRAEKEIKFWGKKLREFSGEDQLSPKELTACVRNFIGNLKTKLEKLNPEELKEELIRISDLESMADQRIFGCPEGDRACQELYKETKNLRTIYAEIRGKQKEEPEKKESKKEKVETRKKIPFKIKKEEKEREFMLDDKVMWESRGEAQWKEPKKIIAIREYKGQKFAFFEDSSTGIPLDQLKLEKAEREKEKPPTLDEQIAQKQKELEEVEMKHNIYYSPVVQDLFGLYYDKRLKDLRKELKELKGGRGKPEKKAKEEIREPKTMPEKLPTVKEYLNHIRETDKLYTEMLRIRGKVKRGELKPEEYEKAKAKLQEAIKKTMEMESCFDKKTLDKIIIIREKERKKKGPLALLKKLWNGFLKLIAKISGKETIEEVKRDALEEQLEAVKKRIRESGVLGRAALEKEQTRLEKLLKKYGETRIKNRKTRKRTNP